jgi:hypothetical protein
MGPPRVCEDESGDHRTSTPSKGGNGWSTCTERHGKPYHRGDAGKDQRPSHDATPNFSQNIKNLDYAGCIWSIPCVLSRCNGANKRIRNVPRSETDSDCGPGLAWQTSTKLAMIWRRSVKCEMSWKAGRIKHTMTGLHSRLYTANALDGALTLNWIRYPAPAPPPSWNGVCWIRSSMQRKVGITSYSVSPRLGLEERRNVDHYNLPFLG